MTKSPKYLGIDLGGRKVGVAIADSQVKLAKGIKTIPRKIFEEEIAKFLKEENIEFIVMGLPSNMDGTESKRTEETREYAQELSQKLNIPVYLQDERLTSWLARNLLYEMGYKKAADMEKLEDQMAAQIILQDYINQKFGTNYST